MILDEGSFTIPLEEDHAALLKECRGSNVTLGLRPEHILSSRDACERPVKLTLRHEVSELLGNEMYLYLSSGNHRITGRSNTVTHYELGQQIDVYADMARAHFFDVESGKRIHT